MNERAVIILDNSLYNRWKGRRNREAEMEGVRWEDNFQHPQPGEDEEGG